MKRIPNILFCIIVMQGICTFLMGRAGIALFTWYEKQDCRIFQNVTGPTVIWMSWFGVPPGWPKQQATWATWPSLNACTRNFNSCTLTAVSPGMQRSQELRSVQLDNSLNHHKRSLFAVKLVNQFASKLKYFLTQLHSFWTLKILHIPKTIIPTSSITE